MPILSSSYISPVWLQGGHMQTVFPSLFRKASPLHFTREVIELPCNDVIDVDWITGVTQSTSIVIFSHGMEGNSKRKYITGMAKQFLQAGFDIVSRNCRGCSETMNKLAPMYHSGQTEDLHTLVATCIAKGYSSIILAGFSMGGNQTLKYLGELGTTAPAQLTCAVTFSVPCDLTGCAQALAQTSNALYVANFLHTLRRKVQQKHKQFPAEYPLQGLQKIRTLEQFDNRYTAPLFNYTSAKDYWQKESSLPLLASIAVPTLMVNAKNDPFLSPSCFPYPIALHSKYLYLETPQQGGHVGFTPRTGTCYWSDKRAVEFVQEIMGKK